jgi:hypothetical protein
VEWGLFSNIIGERYAYCGGLSAGVGRPVLPGKDAFLSIKLYESIDCAGDGSRSGIVEKLE